MIAKVPIISNLKRAFSVHNLWLLAGIYILVPEHIISYPRNGLDPSWMTAINRAVEQHLTFGRDGYSFLQYIR